MAKTVVGLFDSMNEARQVVRELIDNSCQSDDISIVAQHEGETITERGDDRTSGVAVGAGAGAAVGGLGGLLLRDTEVGEGAAEYSDRRQAWNRQHQHHDQAC